METPATIMMTPTTKKPSLPTHLGIGVSDMEPPDTSAE